MQALTLFKCLSDETRLHAVLLLTEMGELCVCELMTALNENQPKVSRHLAQLRQCDLLLDERRGQWVFYRLNPTLPDWVKTLLETTAKQQTHLLRPLKKRLAAGIN